MQLGKSLLFLFVANYAVSPRSHKSFIDTAAVSWLQVQYVKSMKAVGGLPRMSVAAQHHKGLSEDICFLAEGRVDLTSVFPASSAALATLGPTSGAQ